MSETLQWDRGIPGEGGRATLTKQTAAVLHARGNGIEKQMTQEMHFDACAVNTQGERLSGLEDRKAFPLLTQSNYACIALSPQIKESTVWKSDPRCGCSGLITSNTSQSWHLHVPLIQPRDFPLARVMFSLRYSFYSPK